MSPISSFARPGFELSGPPGAPIVVVLGGISATRHVTATATDPTPGWWADVVGPGRPLDTRVVQVLGVDWITRPDRPVTTRDQADAIAGVLDALGVACVASIVGSSYGGMVALAFAAAHPGRAGRLALLAAAHRAHPMASAHRLIQRRIIHLGLAAGLPTVGLSLARALGITTYRTAIEFRARFGTVADVASYLEHQGNRFAARWDPERYLALSESLDLHEVDPGAVRTPTALFGIREDTLVPSWQLAELRDALGAPCLLELHGSPYGHDAFLKEPGLVGAFLSRALASEVPCAA